MEVKGKDTVSADIISAIENYENIISLVHLGKSRGVSDNKRSAFLRSLRTRARSGPGDIIINGLSTQLLFLLSKSGKSEVNVYMKLVEALNSKRIEENIIDDALGYAAYLYLVLKRCEELGFIDKSDLEEPVSAIKKLVDKEPIVTPMIMGYLNEIKKLASATIDEKGNIILKS